jgi:exonuclease SbcC
MIRQLTLHNFTTYEDASPEFGNGKNVIIGETGSGKTNLLLALDFAFTGEVPGTTIAGLIADDADMAEVTLDYVEPRTGQSYRIRRTLTRNASGGASHECSFTNLDNGELVSRPEAVQKTLEALGVDSSVFRHVIHLPQGSFGEVLEETQERRNSLDRLFQVSQLENAYQELGRQEGPIQQIENRKETRLRTKSALEAVAAKLNEEKANLDNLTKERREKQTQLEAATKEHDQLEGASKNTMEVMSKLDAVDETCRNANATIQSTTAQVESLISKLHELLPPQDCERIGKQTSAETAAHLGLTNSSLAGLKAEEDSLEKNYTQSTEQSAATQTQIDLVEQERKTKSGQMNLIQAFLEGKAEQPQIKCDKCGTLLTRDQWGKHISEETEALQALKTKIDELARELQTHRALADKYKEKIEEIESKREGLKNAALLLEELVKQRQELEEAAGVKTQSLQQKGALVNELRSLLRAEPTLPEDQITEQARSLKQRLDLLSSQVRELDKDLQRYDEYHLNPQKKRLAEAEDAVSQLKKLEPEIQLDEKKIMLLQTIRNSLREIQPAVRRNFTSRITQSANDYLKRLYRRPEIDNFELTDDYQFFVTRAGYKRHANRLSGGQQVLASMAFLLALSEVLSQLDFLILDEPTTHLDESRRRELVTVLENLRRVPQLIIVDHHAELFEAADTRFRVTLVQEGKSMIEQVTAEKSNSK